MVAQKITDEAEFIRVFKGGKLSYNQMAAHFGVSRATIMNMRDKCKLSKRGYIEPNTTIYVKLECSHCHKETTLRLEPHITVATHKEFTDENIRQDFENHVSQRRMSEKYGYCESKIQKKLKSMGLRKPKTKKVEPSPSKIEPSQPIIKQPEKRLIPPSLRELQRQELNEKIKLTQQINMMSKKQMDDFDDY